jgi:hypothetical protein
LTGAFFADDADESPDPEDEDEPQAVITSPTTAVRRSSERRVHAR